jgi:monoamine oxidase
MPSRKQFIKDASLLSGALWLGTTGFSNLFLGSKYKVIIIGAGFAGLAAAYKLFQKKIDFVILEARNRIGGRVFSYTMDEKEKLIIELGAEWVGESHERLQNLCNEFGLELQDNKLETDLIYKGQYFKSRRGHSHYSDAWEEKFASLVAAYKLMNEEQKIEMDKIDWWRYLVINGCNGRDLDLRILENPFEMFRHLPLWQNMPRAAKTMKWT